MGRLIFEGVDSSNNDELWVSDPSDGNIEEIKLANGGYVPNGGLLGNNFGTGGPELLSADGSVFLRGEDKNGTLALFVYTPPSSGTASGTAKEIVGVVGTGGNANFNGLDPTDFVAYNGNVYFNGENSSGTPYDPGLWITDGTTAGTHEIAGTPFDPDNMAVYNGELYMNGKGADGTQDLFAYNPNTNTGRPFIEITPNLNPTDLTDAAAGTYVFDPLTGKDTLNSNPSHDLFMNANNALYVSKGSTPTEISAAQGTNPEDIVAVSTPAQPSFFSQNRGDLVQYDGVVFSGVDSKGERGLWFSDGTSGGTREIPGTSGLDPYDITFASNKIEVFFTGNDGGAGGAGRGLFVYLPNFNVVEEVLNSSQFNFGSQYNNGNNSGVNFGDFNPNTLTMDNGNLYFNAAQPGHGTQLYELTVNNAGNFTGTLVASTNANNGLAPTSLTHS
jgi:hypothetical protein